MIVRRIAEEIELHARAKYVKYMLMIFFLHLCLTQRSQCYRNLIDSRRYHSLPEGLSTALHDALEKGSQSGRHHLSKPYPLPMIGEPQSSLSLSSSTRSINLPMLRL